MSSTLPSPLRAALDRLRDQDLPTAEFRRTTHTLSYHLAVCALDALPWSTGIAPSPVGPVPTPRLDSLAPVVVPVLRAGLAMLSGVLEATPSSPVAPVGLARDEESLTAHWYLPAPELDLSGLHAWVCDPMLATGGTVAEVGSRLEALGAESVSVLAILAAPEGLAVVESHGWTAWVGCVDSHLDERGYITPGLGDAGDRWCATPRP